MKEKRVLSIIIPVYNADKTISECLDSILISKNMNIEIIIIDDGSTDNSNSICKMYENKDNRVKLISQSNHGVSYSRNLGMMNAKGTYIMFVDSDDVLTNDWSNIIFNNINSDVDVYYFSSKLNCDADKMKILTYIIGNNDEKICFSGPFSKIISKEFLLKNEISFNTELINGEDMLFNVETILSCSNYKVIKNSFYNYRNIVGSATKRFEKNIFDSDKMFHTLLNNIFEKKLLDEKTIDKYKKYCLQTAIVMLAYRISFISNYSNAKGYFKNLNIFPYSNCGKIILNMPRRVVIHLVKMRLYFIVYYALKLLNFIKMMKKGKSYFAQI